MKFRVWLCLIVSAVLTSGCFKTGALRTVVDVTVDAANGATLGGNLVPGIANEISRSQGPMLYWQNRYGGWHVVSYDGYEIPLVSDQCCVRMVMVCNCEALVAVIKRNGAEVGSFSEDSWDLPLPNHRTNSRYYYTAEVRCAENNQVVYTRQFRVLDSGPRMDSGYRRW